MAHREQRAFCERVKTLYPEMFTGTTVLEMGSRNVNGTIRDLFVDCAYTGVDCFDGKDVDVVSLAHEYRSDIKFDVVCSTEMLEHDPHWLDSLDNMLWHLRPGGLIFVTCAGTGRGAHGVGHGDDQYGPTQGYYHNIALEELAWMCGWMRMFHVERDDVAHDTYMYGVKR